MTLNQDQIDSLSKTPIVIFGAGAVGEVLWYACQQKGLNTVAFCDNNTQKVGNLKCGLPIIATIDIPSKHPKACILVSAADMQDVVGQLETLGCTHWIAGSELLHDFDVYTQNYTVPTDFAAYAVDTCILCQDSYLNPDKLFMRSVDVVITERCSLKCRDCSNLMQYYDKPQNYSAEEILRTSELLCELADEINEFRVIGGEPLMNRDYDQILRSLCNISNVKKIVIYTNGTLLPTDSKLDSLNHEKILFIITDYGELSKNLASLQEILEKNNIAHYIQKAQGWTDCSKIKEHQRTWEQQRELFRNCCAKNTTTMLDGRLYRCPFAAHVMKLEAVPDFPEDYIDLDYELAIGTDNHTLKAKIMAYLRETLALKVCDYCFGRSFDAEEIQPAIQTATPLAYKRHPSRVSNPTDARL